MKLQVYTQSGEKQKEIEAPAIFDTTVSDKTLALYYNYIRASVRFPIADTLGRGEVSGGGKKPWRQKGTGNARVGSTRSPLWVGGGVTFGPSSERNFTLRMNKKERRRALYGMLSRLAAENKVVVIDKLEISGPKTKVASEVLSSLDADGKIAIVESIDNNNAWLSFRNIAGVQMMDSNKLNFTYLLAADKVIITRAALDKIGKSQEETVVSKEENE